MKIEKKSLPKSQMEFIVELSDQELEPYLKKTAEEISKNKKITGFRPGKAPYDIVVREVGEMFIYQTAGNQAIEGTIFKILEQENLEIVDEPKIEVQKLAPNNPFIYKATVALVPEITICEFDKIKVKPMAKVELKPEEIDKVLEDLRKMRAKQTLEDKKAEMGDMVEINFQTFMDNVPIEGGQADKHQLVLGDGKMIPGFEEQVVGLGKDEEKEFDLDFPKKYHEEKLAGKQATFKIKVLAVYKIELPELNDEFGKNFGLKDLASLKSNIESNLKQEKENKEKQRVELELIEKLIEQSEFAELPEVLVTEESHKMVHELEDNVAKQGINFADYLKHLKKTEGDLILDFAPDAIKRVKTGLLIRAIAKRENLKAEETELEQEIEKTLASYKLHPSYADKMNELEQNIRSDNAKQYFQNVIINRKTVEFLKDKIVDKKS